MIKKGSGMLQSHDYLPLFKAQPSKMVHLMLMCLFQQTETTGFLLVSDFTEYTHYILSIYL